MKMKTAPKSLSFAAAVLIISLVLPSCAARESLYSGQRLTSGQSLVSGRYLLTMQGDCNLVLYGPAAIWSSGTFRKGVGCFAYLSYTGFLGVYNGAGVRLWASGAALGTGNYILNLQFDRNLVIYGPARWSSRTNIATAGINITITNP